MTNMFKKSLLAVAIAGLSTTAMAATVSSTAGIGISSEWAATADATAAVTVAGFTYKLAASHTINDIVEFTFSDNSLVLSTMPSTVNSVDTSYTLAQLSNRLENGKRVVVYRITQATTPAPDNSEFLFGNIEFGARDIKGTVSVATRAETNTGQPLDKNASADLIYVGTQFAAVVPSATLNSTIDVGTSRFQFLGGSAQTGSTSNTGSYSVVPALPRAANANATPAITAVNFDPSYTVNTATTEYVLAGDFGFLTFDEDGDYDNTGDVTVVGSCVGSDEEVTATEIITECTSGNAYSVGFAVAAGNETLLSPQAFGLDANVAYTNGTATGTAKLSTAAGTWRLNGSSVNVPYMPYSSTITQVINVTNRSAQTGDVSVTAIAEDGTVYNLGVVGQSEARTITPIARNIIDALSAAVGEDLSKGTTKRFAFNIVTNAPNGSVEVYSAYNTNGAGARLVVNDSNGK